MASACRSYHQMNSAPRPSKSQRQCSETRFQPRVKVSVVLLDGVAHAFDKSPNLFRFRFPRALVYPLRLHENTAGVGGVKICCIDTVVVTAVPHGGTGF